MKAKRIISCILMLLMLASLMPAGFADITWSNNTTQVNPGGFTVVDPDAGNEPAPQAESSTGGHTHNWQNLKTELEATCTSYGMATQVCYDCGATQTVYTDMLPHTWSEWEITIYATDHTAGEKQRTCQVCGKVDIQKYYLEGTVLPGSTGEEVIELQDLLNQNGIPAPQDGEYGDATREAVREVQRRNGFEVDGIAWLQTVNCLRHRFGEWEVVQEATLTKPGRRQRVCEKCGYTEVQEYMKALGPGARNDAVKELQDMLEALGYYHGRRDGDYGQAVSKAVGDAQEDGGFERTGIADETFLEWLFHQYWQSPTYRERRDADNSDDEETIPRKPSDQPPKDGGMGGGDDRVAAAHLEYVVFSEPKNGMYYTAGEKINYALRLVNDGDFAIISVEGYYCDENLDNLNGTKADGLVVLDPPAAYVFKMEEDENPIKSGQGGFFEPSPRKVDGYEGSIHTVSDYDMGIGEFTDAAYAFVKFENGEYAECTASLRLLIGGNNEPRAALYFTYDAPKNGVFFTVNEEVYYNLHLVNYCGVSLDYKIYQATAAVLEKLNRPYHDPVKGTVDAWGSHIFPTNVDFNNAGLYPSPVYISQWDCKEGSRDVNSVVARCTFKNIGTLEYLAALSVPCGIEEPGAMIEIVETSEKENGEYYTPGETITYDIELTNTGNLIMSSAEISIVLDNGEHAVYNVSTLAPGASRTIYSGQTTATMAMLEKGSYDVSTSGNCTFTSAKGNVQLPVNDEKSFPIDGKPAAHLELTLESTPNGSFFREDEEAVYVATVVNVGDIELTSANVSVSFNGATPEALGDTGAISPKDSSINFLIEHTVTKDDANAGTLTCTVTADCTFADGTIMPLSETITVDTGNPALKVDIVVSSTAPDGFYKRNEAIEYQVTVSNIGSVSFATLNLDITLPDGSNFLLAEYNYGPGSTDTLPYAYTVEMNDVAQGNVKATATATGTLEDGEGVSASATVTVTTGMLPVNLSVEKVVTSTSTYSFYEENDTITYSITVTNNGKEAIPSVDVIDNSPAGMSVLGTISEMAPGASISYPYAYTVTGADVTAGNVHNIGEINAVLPDGTGYSAASEVDSATGKYVPPVENVTKGGGEDNDGDKKEADSKDKDDQGEEGTGPVVWYLHETVTDGVRTNALDQGIEMSITLYEDGRAEIEVNKETTPAFWTEDKETITVTAEEKENLYVKVEDTLENDQEGTLMIFRREKPEPSIKE